MVQENQILDIPQSGEEEEKRFGHPHTRGEMDNVWDIPTPGERWTTFETSPLQGRDRQRLGHPHALQIWYRQNLYQRQNSVTQFLFATQDLSKALWIHPKQCTQLPQVLIVYWLQLILNESDCFGFTWWWHEWVSSSIKFFKPNIIHFQKEHCYTNQK